MLGINQGLSSTLSAKSKGRKQGKTVSENASPCSSCGHCQCAVSQRAVSVFPMAHGGSKRGRKTEQGRLQRRGAGDCAERLHTLWSLTVDHCTQLLRELTHLESEKVRESLGDRKGGLITAGVQQALAPTGSQEKNHQGPQQEGFQGD